MGVHTKDSLDLAVDAFVAELDSAGVPHTLATVAPPALRKAMTHAIATYAMLQRTAGDDATGETH
jgi:hypothetical protein